MRVISMVPSLTETLLQAGVQVVGRTRFCIHPSEKVGNIPIVGGTKDVDWKKIKKLGADLLILDQEENPKSMADESPIPWHSTHIRDFSTAARDFAKLGETLGNSEIQVIGHRWDRLVKARDMKWDFSKIPGEIEKLSFDLSMRYEQLIYVIWKNPWMSVSGETFIGCGLKKLGASGLLPNFLQAYPEFKIEDYDLSKTYFLFSSEPFPFAKKKDELLKLGLKGASIVDGELFSWFGIRSLKFFENYLEI